MEWNDDTRVDDLPELTPEQAAQVFATKYDEPIQGLRHALGHFDYGVDQYDQMLAEVRSLIVDIMPIPRHITVGGSRPYVEASDLITLGRLAYELFLRQDQIEKKVREEGL